MNEFFKKNLNLLIIVLIVLSFNLIAHTFWSNYFCTTGTTKLPDINNTLKEWNTGVVLTGSKIDWRTILNTKPVIRKSTTSTTTKATTQEWVKSVLGVSAGYEWETSYERTRNQIIKLWVSYEIAEHITWEAYTNTEDPKLFIKNIVWVSNAEGSIFKRGMYNNYLGVMARMADGSYWLRHYDTVQLAITHWREMYNRNKWYVRTTPQRWLDGNYCSSECKFWVQNYNAGVYLLNI